MHISTKLALGVVAVLGLALLAKDNLILLFILASAVALLTLKTTWKLIFSVLQMVGILLAGFGHGVGWIGDVIAEWLEAQKRSLVAPDWGSSELHVPATPGTAVESSGELDVPDFLKDEQKRSSDAGLEIFEPADH